MVIPFDSLVHYEDYCAEEDSEWCCPVFEGSDNTHDFSGHPALVSCPACLNRMKEDKRRK